MLIRRLEANPATGGIGLQCFAARSGTAMRKEGENMAHEQAASNRHTRFFTEDWLAVAVGLLLVALVLTGLLKSIP
jgi:hypothetical protein